MPCIQILKLILRGRESELVVQAQPGMCNTTDTGDSLPHRVEGKTNTGGCPLMATRVPPDMRPHT